MGNSHTARQLCVNEEENYGLCAKTFYRAVELKSTNVNKTNFQIGLSRPLQNIIIMPWHLLKQPAIGIARIW